MSGSRHTGDARTSEDLLRFGYASNLEGGYADSARRIGIQSIVVEEQNLSRVAIQ